MLLSWTLDAWDDYLYWQANDKAKLRKINVILKDIVRTPFDGIGKPEPLKFDLTGYWSRRIDAEHRVVYTLLDDAVVIIACRYHYK